MFTDIDIHFMKRALDQAILAMEQNEVPIGSVIVKNETIIGKGYNRVEQTKDATAHAEIIAISSASQLIQNWRLNDSTVYITLEPCSMCMGAIINSRISKIVFGCQDHHFDTRDSVCHLGKPKFLSHSIEIVQGVMKEDCKDLLQLFFRNLRKKGKNKIYDKNNHSLN